MCTVQLADSERVPNHVNLQLWWHPDKFPFTSARLVVSTRHPVSKVAARSVTFLTIQSQTSRHFVWHFPRNRFCPIFLIHLIWLDFALFNIKSQIHLCNRLWLIPCLDKDIDLQQVYLLQSEAQKETRLSRLFASTFAIKAVSSTDWYKFTLRNLSQGR